MIKTVITITLGFAFGSVLIASQAFSWYRIQEMFHFQSFHMFGLLFSAILTGMLGLLIIRRTKAKTIWGNKPEWQPKPLQWKSLIIGGVLFGLGWGISGACSAPVYILAGMHWQSGIFLLLGALIGAFTYGALHKKLPK